MSNARPGSTPKHESYDVVIVGGSLMGSAVAWFLASNPAFDGRILVVERDPSYEMTSTAHTTSCMRQQFSTALNVKISQFAAEFVKDLRGHLGGDPRVPELGIRSFGYMYLADNEAFAEHLRAVREIQRAAGAATQLMSAGEIRRAYPFYNVDDILLGSINLRDEGYFDAGAMCEWMRRLARERGADYVSGEVVGMELGGGGRVERVRLASGAEVSCGRVVNAAGPRAAQVAQMAGIALPVEPRKRYSWVFKAAEPLDRDLPLTIDPSGVHVRENGGGTYQAGGHGAEDPAVEPDDFEMDHGLWEEHVWPALAHRIPQFEAIKVQAEWAGHYAMNVIDHNAILGPHPEVENFLFLNGFSGHGLQQAPAMGRAVAEWIIHGGYRSIDMTPFHFDRLAEGRPLLETAVI
ncbi:FAD-binding oxidoreductase [Rhodobacteraceae bacterium 63075]|nr:FAD-binding oxidoreductase [Rhodobacteraceae bacterium 63075]